MLKKALNLFQVSFGIYLHMAVWRYNVARLGEVVTAESKLPCAAQVNRHLCAAALPSLNFHKLIS